MRRLSSAAGCALILFLASACENEAPSTGLVDVTCRGTEVRFADRAFEAPVRELTNEVFLEGDVDVAIGGDHWEISTLEMVVRPPRGEAFELHIQATEWSGENEFLMQVHYREVGTEGWEPLIGDPESLPKDDAYYTLEIRPLEHEGSLVLSYERVRAQSTSCQLEFYLGSNRIDWDWSKDYEYRVRPFVKNRLGELEVGEYPFRTFALLQSAQW